MLETPRTENYSSGIVGTDLPFLSTSIPNKYQNGHLCKTINPRIVSVKNLLSRQSNWQDCTSSNGLARTMKLAVVLDDYVVTSYRDTCTSIIEVFSLDSCKLLWMKSIKLQVVSLSDDKHWSSKLKYEYRCQTESEHASLEFECRKCRQYSSEKALYLQ